MTGPPDLAARQRAATDFETNLVVSAGAGAGKTSLLVERLLVAVGREVAPLERTVAITFTEKAAGEMRQRLATGLERLRRLAVGEVEPDVAHEADRAYLHLTREAGRTSSTIGRTATEALESLDRAAITTIHGFCGDLLRRFPFEAALAPDFTVDAGEHRSERFASFWDRWVAGELGPRAERPDLWRRVLTQFDMTELRLATEAASSFSVDDPLLTAAPPDPIALLARPVEIVREEALALAATGAAFSNRPRQLVEAVRAALDTWRREGPGGLRDLLDADADRAETLTTRSTPLNKKAYGALDPTRFDRFRRDAQRLVRLLRAIDDETVRSLLETIAPAARAFRAAYLRDGFVDFDGLLVLARNLLRDHVHVRDTLKRELQLVLVDEFQDTDPVQYEIVLFLGERSGEHATDAYAASLEPGRLFVVGDAKQSIYRFRGADYTAFQRAIDLIAGTGAHLQLTANFRSRPGVLEPVNRLFDDADGVWSIDVEDAGEVQPPYVAIEPTREDVERPAIEIWQPRFDGKPAAYRRRLGEGALIAETLDAWKETGRIARYRDVTLLFRALTTVEGYLRPLRERGIPFVVDGGKEMLRRPEVAQLLGTLRVLALPSDAPSLLAFLRSPAGAVPDRELADWRASGGAWRWTETPERGQFPELSRAFARLRELHEATRDLPADRAIRRVAESSGLLTLGAAAFEGAQRVANLHKLVAAGEDLARDGRLGLEAVLEALQEGRLEDLKMDRPLADDAADAVRISSIHRMKGLESEWVFLPDLCRTDGDRDDESPVRSVTDASGADGLGVNVGGVRSGLDVWQTLQDRRHSAAEEARVLYVALTRARAGLVLVDSHAAANDPPKADAPRKLPRALRMLGAWGYDAAREWDEGATLVDGSVVVRAPQVERRDDVVARAPARADLDAAAEEWTACIRAYRGAMVSPLGTPSGLVGEADDREAPERPAVPHRGHALGRSIGVVLHLVLERWDRADDAGARRELQRSVEEVSHDHGVDSSSLANAAGPLLDGFLASDLGRRFRTLDIVGREVPVVAARDEHGALRGSIDLLYRDDEGLVVADYKTDTEEPDALVERYAPQLRAYADIVAAGTGTRPRGEIWSLVHGAVLDVR